MNIRLYNNPYPTFHVDGYTWVSWYPALEIPLFCKPLKGQSPYGCFYMLDGISEWCQDYYSHTYYRNAPKKNPVCKKGDGNSDGNITLYTCRGDAKLLFRYSLMRLDLMNVQIGMRFPLNAVETHKNLTMRMVFVPKKVDEYMGK